MTAAVGLGAMAGALGLAVFGPSVHRGRAVGWMSAGFGLLVAAFGLAPTLGVALPLLALTGFFQITTTALTNTLLQVLAPDELRGRVVSFYTFAFVGMAPFGALAMGAAAERVGPRVALVVGGAACAVVSGLVLVRRRELRETR
jgi:sugar phosphate permease